MVTYGLGQALVYHPDVAYEMVEIIGLTFKLQLREPEMEGMTLFRSVRGEVSSLFLSVQK